MLRPSMGKLCLELEKQSWKNQYECRIEHYNLELWDSRMVFKIWEKEDMTLNFTFDHLLPHKENENDFFILDLFDEKIYKLYEEKGWMFRDTKRCEEISRIMTQYTFNYNLEEVIKHIGNTV